jgi:hypothetical protein
VARKDQPWELYQIQKSAKDPDDRAENKDLASESPSKVAELSAIWETMTQSFIDLARPTAKTNPPPTKAGKSK